MRRAHPVQCLAASFVLKIKHHLCQVFDAAFFALPFNIDIIILAEDAAHVAAGEKKHSGTIDATEATLFNRVGLDMGHLRAIADLAEANHTIASINVAFVWAEGARHVIGFRLFQK